MLCALFLPSVPLRQCCCSCLSLSCEYFCLFYCFVPTQFLALCFDIFSCCCSSLKLPECNQQPTSHRAACVYFLFQPHVCQARPQQLRLLRPDLGGGHHRLCPQIHHHHPEVLRPLPPQDPPGLQIPGKKSRFILLSFL